MPKFILVYHGGNQTPMSAEEGVRHKERYMAWMREVGAALVSPANPVGPSKIVASDGVSDPSPADAFNGYSVVEVDDMEAALNVAKRCPFLDIGTLEVAPLIEMAPRG